VEDRDHYNSYPLPKPPLAISKCDRDTLFLNLIRPVHPGDATTPQHAISYTKCLTKKKERA
jgi:hypothetical protein